MVEGKESWYRGSEKVLVRPWIRGSEKGVFRIIKVDQEKGFAS